MLELYLLRHGLAEHRAASGRDADRALTGEGSDRAQRVISEAKASGLAPRWIVASPYLRAQQTARIAAEMLGYSEQILTSARLTPDCDPAEVWSEVRELHPDSPLLFVAHEPLLSSAAAWMLGEEQVIEFRPATVVRIDFEAVGVEPRGVLRWKIPLY
jgi:phosphohistidine phosphatase